MFNKFLRAITRKKRFEGNASLDTNLKRCLGLIDITFLALGQMIGAGVYVLTGSVVRNQAGPSVILSFIFAGFAALLSAFSYAEFGARFPRAGSAYTYTYVGLGELWGFIVGWTIPLEYMIGNAAVARSWSAYFDNLLDRSVQNFTIGVVGEWGQPGGFFSQYPDFLAFTLILVSGMLNAFGSKLSSRLNTAVVFLNISVILVVIIAGLQYADFSLWSGIQENGNPKFIPFGLSGTLAGAATCFFSYVGFEALATAGEEVKDPHRNIPLATFLSISIIAILYIFMSGTLTLMLPFDQVDPTAPFAEAFEAKGANTMKYIITIGALLGMSDNIMAGAFVLPRTVYAMAEDGLIFRFFAKIFQYTKVPLNAIVVFTAINAVLALVFDIESLVEFLSIGTLFAYSFVSASVLVLRYQPANITIEAKQFDEGGTLKRWVPFRNFWESLPPGTSISIGVATLISLYFCLAVTVRNECYLYLPGQICIIVNMILILLTILFMAGHNENSMEMDFKVPFLPITPCLSLLVNTFMMTFLSITTWIRLFVWMAVGLLIYFTYGIRNSKEAKRFNAIAEIRMSSTFQSRSRVLDK